MVLKINDHRRRVAQIYDDKLKEIKHIKITKTNPGSARHLYVIRTKRRDSLIKHLFKNKILCQIHYPYSLNRLRPFKKLAKKNYNIKNSERWAKECISLPIHSNLYADQVYRVIDVIKRYFKYK